MGLPATVGTGTVWIRYQTAGPAHALERRLNRASHPAAPAPVIFHHFFLSTKHFFFFFQCGTALCVGTPDPRPQIPQGEPACCRFSSTSRAAHAQSQGRADRRRMRKTGTRLVAKSPLPPCGYARANHTPWLCR